MHKIAKEIINCNKKCFVDRYTDYEYKGKVWKESDISNIKPFINGPDEPRLLLVSQAPSLEAWLNGIANKNPEYVLTDRNNSFFIKDILPVFGLSEETIEIFRNNTFWIHACNCYTWFRERNGRRMDRRPKINEVKQCFGHWKEKVIQIPSLKGIVLMGAPSTYLFLEFYSDVKHFTDLVRMMKIRTDIVKGVEILTIFHQSKNSRIFNNPENKEINNKLIETLKIKFKEWIE